MPLHPNTTILNGKYRILRLIGEGGMARVWQAKEPKFAARYVAIKEPKRFAIGFSPSELERRFDQEIAIAELLRQHHARHVVLAYTVEEYEGTHLLVMPYMAGGSLADKLKQAPTGLPWQEAVRIASQVLEGLTSLHELDIVHRDIKPSNILFDEQGNAYLADFGVAQVHGFTVDRSLMLGGPHPGDPAYAAPEQMRNDGGYLTPAADVFALGCVLFEMLTEKKYKAVERGTRPSELRADVPDWLDSIVMKALAPQPAQRWQTAKDFLEALEKKEPITSAKISHNPTSRLAQKDELRNTRDPSPPKGKEMRASDIEPEEWLGIILSLATSIGGILVAVLIILGIWAPAEGWSDLAQNAIALFFAIIGVAGLIYLRKSRRKGGYEAASTGSPPTFIASESFLVVIFGMFILGVLALVGLSLSANPLFRTSMPATSSTTLDTPTLTATPWPTATPTLSPIISVIDMPDSAFVGQPVDFDASPSVTNGTNVKYHWDFDDGTEANGTQVRHTFWRPGKYTIQLTVRNDEGQQDTAARVLIILDTTTTATVGPTTTSMNLPTSTPLPTPTDTATLTPLPTNTPTPSPTPTSSPTNTPTLTPTSTVVTMISPIDGMVMVYIPKGEFLMGSPDNTGNKDEHPQHTVYLDAFWLDQTEVTNTQFAAFLNEMGNQVEGGVPWLSEGVLSAHVTFREGKWVPKPGYEDHPVVEVSWYGANAYCQWAGRRLPTEAEWEKGARGTGGRTYPWGNQNPNCDIVNFRSKSGPCVGDTTSVGSYPHGASPYGLMDMAGNVSEWVADWYEAEYYAYYARDPEPNPSGPSEGKTRVWRGGSWNSDRTNIRTSVRNHNSRYISTPALGFRCAATP